MTGSASRKQKMKAEVLRHETLAPGIRSLTLRVPELSVPVSPGQFVGVYPNDTSLLLPRPVSICDCSEEEKELRLVYRIAGKGTVVIAGLKEGEETDILGILGNGYPMEKLKDRRVLLLGGGIGIPPMLQLAKDLEGRAQARAVLGFRDEQYLTEDFARHCAVSVATEDGSAGTKGNVIDAVRAEGLGADVFYACGPLPMLRAVSALAEETGAECWLSMEEKMACGIGACLSCVCKTREIDAHSQVRNRRVCTEGPVFRSTEIVL